MVSRWKISHIIGSKKYAEKGVRIMEATLGTVGIMPPLTMKPVLKPGSLYALQTDSQKKFSRERYRKSSQILDRFFDLHFKTNDEYDSYIYVAKRIYYVTSQGQPHSYPKHAFSINSCDPRNAHPYRAEERKETGEPTPRYLSRDWLDSAAKLCASASTDHYITGNGYTRPTKRGSKYNNKLFRLHNIVIDVDCHKDYISDADRDHALQMFVHFLSDYFTDVFPNTIVFTGRGVQLWFALEPCPVKLRKVWINTAVYFIRKAREAIEDLGLKNILEVDYSASRNITGLFRLPTSYNTKAYRFSSVVFLP